MNLKWITNFKGEWDFFLAQKWDLYQSVFNERNPQNSLLNIIFAHILNISISVIANGKHFWNHMYDYCTSLQEIQFHSKVPQIRWLK